MKPILLVITGSKLHNTNVGESDTDFKGMCFPEVDQLIGLKNFDQQKLSNGEPDGITKIEGVIETVKRQIGFIYNGDLSGTETCFAEDKYIVFTTPIAQEICQFGRTHLLSRKLFKAYNAYFRAQLHELQSKKRIGKRKEMVEKFGFDAKFGMHAYRLGCQSIQIMNTHTLNPSLSPDEAIIARRMRSGGYSFAEAMQLLEALNLEMYKAYKASTLRDEPDFNMINSFVMDLHLRYIKGEFDNQFLNLFNDDVLRAIKTKAKELDGQSIAP